MAAAIIHPRSSVSDDIRNYKQDFGIKDDTFEKYLKLHRTTFYDTILQYLIGTPRLHDVVEKFVFRSDFVKPSPLTNFLKIETIATEYWEKLVKFCDDMYKALHSGQQDVVRELWQTYIQDITIISRVAIEVAIRDFLSEYQRSSKLLLETKTLFEALQVWLDYYHEEITKSKPISISGKTALDAIQNTQRTFECIWTIALDTDWIRHCMIMALGIDAMGVTKDYIVKTSERARQSLVAYRGLTLLPFVNRILSLLTHEDKAGVIYLGSLVRLAGYKYKVEWEEKNLTDIYKEIGNNVLTIIKPSTGLPTYLVSEGELIDSGFVIDSRLKPFERSQKMIEDEIGGDDDTEEDDAIWEEQMKKALERIHLTPDKSVVKLVGQPIDKKNVDDDLYAY